MKKKIALVLAVVLLAVIFLPACDLTTDRIPGSGGGNNKKEYRIGFDTGVAGLSVESIGAFAGDPIAAPAPPERDGYQFGGWLYGDELFTFSKMPSVSIILTAKWNKIYTLSFDTTGGTETDPVIAAEGAHIAPPADPQKEGFRFDGWYFDGERYYFTVMPSADTVLSARWAQGVMLSFTTGVGGVTVPSVIQFPGALIVEPEPPMRPGFHFDGWYTGAGATRKRFNFTVMPDTDTVLTAGWVEATKLAAVCVTLYARDGTVAALKYGNSQTNVDDSISRNYYLQATIAVGAPGKGAETGGVKAAPAEFKGRGHGSWDGIKKGFRIKFAVKQEVLGMPASRHWALLQGAWNTPDYTMLRTDIAYGMARSVMSNLAYVARTRPVDLYINGDYHGVYTLAETPRAAEGRLDIESEYAADDSLDSLDTGYLLNYAGGSHMSGENGLHHFGLNNFKTKPGGANASLFAIKSPDPGDCATDGYGAALFKKQTAYIRGYMQEVADALMRAGENQAEIEALIDVPSFVDGYIMQELYVNHDVGFGGFYIYKVKGGKLYAGPIWDFDWTVNENKDTSGTTVGDGNTKQQANPFCTYLYSRAWFKAKVAARWTAVSAQLKTYLNDRYADSYLSDADNRYAFGRNLTRWPVGLNSRDLGQHKPLLSQSAGENYWGTEMIRIKNWLNTRIAWLDGAWK